MAIFSSIKPKVTVTAGLHTMRLDSIKSARVASKYSSDADGKIEKLAWRFVDMAGAEFTYWTGTKYGKPGAPLTEIIDALRPGTTVETVDALDEKTLINEWYTLQLEDEVTETGTYLRLTGICQTAVPEGYTPPAAKKPGIVRLDKPMAIPGFGGNEDAPVAPDWEVA